MNTRFTRKIHFRFFFLLFTLFLLLPTNIILHSYIFGWLKVFGIFRKCTFNICLLKKVEVLLVFFFVFFAPLHLISCILFFWSASRIFDKMDYNRDRFELSETQRKWRERKKAERKVSKQSTGTFQQCIRTEAPEINVWEVMTIENDEVSRKV